MRTLFSWPGRRRRRPPRPSRERRDPYVPLSDDEIRAHGEACWALMSEADRELCVNHLRRRLSSEFLADVRGALRRDRVGWLWSFNAQAERDAGGIPMPFHFAQGMGVRNLLREVFSDDRLPGAPGATWDDAYIPALERAAMRGAL